MIFAGSDLSGLTVTRVRSADSQSSRSGYWTDSRAP